MKRKRKKIITPSEFYRLRRPEYFSDTKIMKEYKLPREILAFELEKITTNQKENEFEILCRKLAEKLIAPNLIPQVGPTGGGDGKTDSETYPVSDNISDRWFIPENGWDKNEKWAFAFSAKKTWKSKAKKDIQSIIGTAREFTRIYFITNQCPSSKKKKDAQDEFIKEFKIDIVILDGIWIIEKVYSKNLINIVIKCLNLSQVYLKEKKVIGKNDTSRLKELEKLEEQINNQNRYFEYDFQLVEDALESAILSRMLEKPRDEIEGKFDRVKRFCKKTNFNKQWIRYHYQRAWTYLNWYDDYSSFIQEFNNLKKLITSDSSISEIELYFNLFNLLRRISFHEELQEFNIDITLEEKEIVNLLKSVISDNNKPCSALIAKSHLAFTELINMLVKKNNCDIIINKLSSIVQESSTFIEFPFDSLQKVIEEFGQSFPDSTEYDKLIETTAFEAEKRRSVTTAGLIYLQRASQKIQNKLYKDSIIYFGKSVIKLAKEETSEGMYHALMCLGFAYKELGLFWASNNCFVTAAHNSIRDWFESGRITIQLVKCLKQLANHELLIGRIPVFLSWFEMYKIFAIQINYQEKENEISIEQLLDGCLCTRLLNSNLNYIIKQDYLPELLEKKGFILSSHSVLFILGYLDKILNEIDEQVISNEKELLEYFSLVASQPFRNQIIYETNFIESARNKISTKILGCSFFIHYESEVELILSAETIISFLECFLATCFLNIIPKVDKIEINLYVNHKEQFISFKKESINIYNISINNLNITTNNFSEYWNFFISITSDIIAHNFIIKEGTEYLKKLFSEEELHERLSLILYHRNFVFSLLGNLPKFTIDKWINEVKIKYTFRNKELPQFIIKECPNSVINEDFSCNPNFRHNNIKLVSLINIDFWDKAKWIAFGVISHPSVGIGLILCFKNSKYAHKIFDEWISKFTKEELSQILQITIIRGINKNNPHWYRVQICPNITQQKSINSRYLILYSRINEMTPSNSNNIEFIIDTYEKQKKFLLFPAQSVGSDNQFHPFIDKGILVENLKVIQAWEIGENDIERGAIKKEDNPIIPKNVIDAPVIKVLENIRKNHL